jgi:hypothetical protein
MPPHLIESAQTAGFRERFDFKKTWIRSHTQ